MAVTVKLPTILRKFAGNEARVSAEGATLAEVLKDLESRYPGHHEERDRRGRRPAPVHQRLRERRGRALPGSLETEVADGDTVSILPAVAGG